MNQHRSREVSPLARGFTARARFHRSREVSPRVYDLFGFYPKKGKALPIVVTRRSLAPAEGRERVYLVEPIGYIEDDPDLTDKKFPGNPIKSYRSIDPFKVVGEVTIWRPANVLRTL